MTDATHWGVGEVDMTWNDEDSAIEQHLDNHAVPLPEMITVDGYKPMELPASRALSIIEGHADLGKRSCERAELRERKALMLADWSGHPADVADAADATERRIRRCGHISEEA